MAGAAPVDGRPIFLKSTAVGNSSQLMTRKPTFEMLCERRELSVIYPETGKRFTITLRDWQGMLWAVRGHPSMPTLTDRYNPFVTKHRILDRMVIEAWLQRLRLARTKPAGPLPTSSATS